MMSFLFLKYWSIPSLKNYFLKQVNDMTAADTEKTGSSSNEALQRSATIPDSPFTEGSSQLAAGAGVVESSGKLYDGFFGKAEDSVRDSRADIEEYNAVANGAA